MTDQDEESPGVGCFLWSLEAEKKEGGIVEQRYSGYRVEDVLARLACGSLQVRLVRGEGAPEMTVTVEVEGLINRSRLVRVRLITTGEQTRSGERMDWEARPCHAVVLARSSDWYWHSLHCYAHPADCIIAGVHDTMVDVPVIALDEERLYSPGQGCIQSFSEEHFPERLRKTHFGHRLLVSGLLAGRPDALDRLKRLPASTRRRLLAELKRLRVRRPGRPLALS